VDGTFEDITGSSDSRILENTAALVRGYRHTDGRQDLIVERSRAVTLSQSRSGKFRIKPDAFQFAKSSQGTFTGARHCGLRPDGWLDIYFCLYAYYQGTDQIPLPPCLSYEAENGRPIS